MCFTTCPFKNGKYSIRERTFRLNVLDAVLCTSTGLKKILQIAVHYRFLKAGFKISDGALVVIDDATKSLEELNGIWTATGPVFSC